MASQEQGTQVRLVALSDLDHFMRTPALGGLIVDAQGTLMLPPAINDPPFVSLRAPLFLHPNEIGPALCLGMSTVFDTHMLQGATQQEASDALATQAQTPMKHDGMLHWFVSIATLAARREAIEVFPVDTPITPDTRLRQLDRGLVFTYMRDAHHAEQFFDDLFAM